jgi:glutathione S-transferase
MAPILFTFRRCPYAIRARMTLAYAHITAEHREVDLKNKPQELIDISSKATVPTLVLEDGRVLDESIEIMKWALAQCDPNQWIRPTLTFECNQLVQTNDQQFKPILDAYKYPQRTVRNDPIYYREQAQPYFEQLNTLLRTHRYLLADQLTFADIALFPFIRQFYFVDTTWFEESNYPFLRTWLEECLNSDLFLAVMKK